MTVPSLADLDHQLEKLEFALAISQTIGDELEANDLRDQIKRIGICSQEPGT
tara:strand:+ start:1443 stop:1598 length:156 start_codon:yes stop_codon:yes gene_type:complete